MNIKITFENMEHSAPLEAHAREKLAKISEFIQGPEWQTPKYLELWLKAQKLHPHSEAEIHLKTPQFDLNTHYKDKDLYFALNKTIDIMVELLKKEKEKFKDKNQKTKTDKTNFSDDKYGL